MNSASTPMRPMENSRGGLARPGIPKDYVLRNWSQTLDMLDYINDPDISEQSIIVALR